MSRSKVVRVQDNAGLRRGHEIRLPAHGYAVAFAHDDLVRGECRQEQPEAVPSKSDGVWRRNPGVRAPLGSVIKPVDNDVLLATIECALRSESDDGCPK